MKGIAVDLTGRRFGLLTVVSRVGTGISEWNCACDCGATRTAKTTRLLNGVSTHCGCAGRELLIGKRFGRLTVMAFAGYQNCGGRRQRKWRCQCDCGDEATAITASLMNGTTRSCGCLRGIAGFKRVTGQTDASLPTKDLSGRIFGRLRVVEFDGYRDGRGYWRCECACGNPVIAQGTSLATGNTQSCGCFHRQRASEARTGQVPACRLAYGESSLRRLFRSYHRQAHCRGIPFAITLEEFRAITSGDCHYCGAEPASITRCGRSFGPYLYNGIDRVDNNKGYVLGNCVSCCEICNKAKRHLDAETFIAWVRRAYEHLHRAQLLLSGADGSAAG